MMISSLDPGETAAMFTGLVQQLGTVLQAEGRDPMRLEIELERPLEGLELGESLAVDGVCLTVTSGNGRSVRAQASHETLARTTLGGLRPGAKVHLERALRASSLLGGHLVQGHVDGVGTVRDVRPVQGSVRLEVLPPGELLRYMVLLGSIAVDGVSLTIVDMGAGGAERPPLPPPGSLEGFFAVNLVPHTVASTHLGAKRPGDRVNLEVDLVAKYLERLLQPYQVSAGVTEELLRKGGYQ